MRSIISKQWILNIGGLLLALGQIALGQSDTPCTAGNAGSYSPVMSPSGRFVLFASAANNLLPDGANVTATQFPSILNVYLRDRTSNTTTLVSAAFDGASGGNSHSFPVDISDDGRYALFESTASNLAPGDTNNANDIFLRDTLNGVTILVSANMKGIPGNKASANCSMTPDGRYVAFASDASDTNNGRDVFVRDIQAGTTRLASVGATAGRSDLPQITPNGHYVAFQSSASGLVPTGRGAQDVYVRDLTAAKTYLASTNAVKLYGASTTSSLTSISDDGQVVIYSSSASSSSGTFSQNLLTGVCSTLDSGLKDVTSDARYIAAVLTNKLFVIDTKTSNRVPASVTTDNQPSSSTFDSVVINKFGTHVAFYSFATNLVNLPVVNGKHLYVRNINAGITYFVGGNFSASTGGDTSFRPPCLSANGSLIAFDCATDSLVPGDNNQQFDVFVQNLATGDIELISRNASTQSAISASAYQFEVNPSVSGNGRYVAFSTSTRTNACRNVFVHDLTTGTDVPVSLDLGSRIPATNSLEPSLSSDGRFVAFSSVANNLVANDNNGMQDVFVRDLQAGVTTLVSIGTNGNPGTAASKSPLISADGQKVMFRSQAKNLAPVYSTTRDNLFVRDLAKQLTYAITTNGAGPAAMTTDGAHVAFSPYSATGIGMWNAADARPVTWSLQSVNYGLSTVPTDIAIADDGSMIACSIWTNLVILNTATSQAWLLPGPTTTGTLHFSSGAPYLTFATSARVSSENFGTISQVYLLNYQTQQLRLVSRSWDSNAGGNAPSTSCVISAGGRFIAYRSFASNLVPNDKNNAPDVFLFDTQTDTTTLLSLSVLGSFPANYYSLAPVFSADGKTLVFQTWASDARASASAGLLSVKLASADNVPFSVETTSLNTPGRNPVLKWPAASLKQYQVEYKDHMNDATWQKLNGKATVLGSTVYAPDLAPSSAQRFYRVKQLDP